MEPKAPQDSKAPASGGKHSRTWPVRVMIIDDSLTVRTAFSRIVDNDPKLRVVSTVSNAERAIAILREKPVDIVLLDLQMPGMSGLDALPEILSTAKGAQVLVVSSLTSDGAEHSVAALAMGAADTMPKPPSGGFDETYRKSLLDRIHALGGIDTGEDRRVAPLAPPPGSAQPNSGRRKPPEVLAIGGSTGAIHALNILLRGLPRSFDLPILVTQHLPASFIPVFARQVELASARRTRIADDGTPITRGEIAIAGAEGHMIVRREQQALVARVSRSPVRNGCKPSVDPMLASLADATDGHAIAVILSGMGRDGVEGAAKLAQAGGSVLAQDEASSAVWGMPGAVVKEGIASAICSPEALVNKISEYCGAPAWR